MILAIAKGHLEVVEFLLQLPDIDLRIKAFDGNDAYSIAVDKGYQDIADLIQVMQMSKEQSAEPLNTSKVNLADTLASSIFLCRCNAKCGIH